jgi:dTDP-4-amino-4,6-dideoxygalactose transaminase
MIPIAKVVLDKEIDEVVKVLKSGNLREGEVCKRFEEEFAKFVDAKYAYVTSSGTTALLTAYLSTLKQGDEVILPAFTHISTANALLLAGAKPVFVDIEQDYFTIDINSILENITSRTRAIVPVHLFGQPCDMKAILEIAHDYKLLVISDSCQAHGAKYKGKDVGSLGDLSCYSLYATKNMTSGEGGIVTTNNEDFYKKGRLIKSHGETKKYYHEYFGLNFRFNDILAAIALIQLSKLPLLNQKRIKNAKFLTKMLKDVDIIQTPKVREECIHVFHQYSVLLNINNCRISRNEFVDVLNKRGIQAMVHYPIPITKQPFYSKLLKNLPKLSNCEDVASRIFSLPVHPYLLREELEKIVNCIKEIARDVQKR